jgi:aromatic ring hydroxylase
MWRVCVTAARSFSTASVPPQVDRSQPAHKQPEPFLYPGVVRETDAGIVVRGAQSIATSAVLADWLFLSYITPLVEGDEDYAISIVMPASASSCSSSSGISWARSSRAASSSTRCSTRRPSPS